MTGSRGCGGPSSTSASGRPSRAPARLRPRARGPRPSLRRGRPVRRGRAGDRLQPACGASGQRRACLRRCRDAAAHRDRDRDRGRARARRRPARARLGQPSGGQGDRCAGGLRVGGGDCPRAGQRGAARPGGDRLRGGLLAPGVATRDAIELLEEALAAVDDESDELRIGLLAGLARALDFAGGARARGARARKRRRAGKASTGTARGLRRCWFAPTGRAARPRWRRSSRC